VDGKGLYCAVLWMDIGVLVWLSVPSSVTGEESVSSDPGRRRVGKDATMETSVFGVIDCQTFGARWRVCVSLSTLGLAVELPVRFWDRVELDRRTEDQRSDVALTVQEVSAGRQ
jgi:hypothetical protein